MSLSSYLLETWISGGRPAQAGAVSSTVLRGWKRLCITYRSLFTWTNVGYWIDCIPCVFEEKTGSSAKATLSLYACYIYTLSPIGRCSMSTQHLHNSQNAKLISSTLETTTYNSMICSSELELEHWNSTQQHLIHHPDVDTWHFHFFFARMTYLRWVCVRFQVLVKFTASAL